MVDLFIIDIKILDEDSCLKNIKGDFKTFGDNIEEIMRKNKSYIFRFPLVKPLTFNEKNITYLYDFIKGYNIKYLEIFKTHTLASDKYESLGLKPEVVEEITDEEMDMLKKRLTNDLGIKVNILKF